MVGAVILLKIFPCQKSEKFAHQIYNTSGLTHCWCIGKVPIYGWIESYFQWYRQENMALLLLLLFKMLLRCESSCPLIFC